MGEPVYELADALEESDRISQEALLNHGERMRRLTETEIARPAWLFISTFFEGMTRELLHRETEMDYTELNDSFTDDKYRDQLQQAHEVGALDEDQYQLIDSVRTTRNRMVDQRFEGSTDTLNEALELYGRIVGEATGAEFGDLEVRQESRDCVHHQINELKDAGLYGAAMLHLYDRGLQNRLKEIGNEAGYDTMFHHTTWTGEKDEVSELAIEKEMDYIRKQFSHSMQSFEPDRYDRLVDEHLLDQAYGLREEGVR